MRKNNKSLKMLLMTIFVVIFGVIYVAFTDQNEEFVESKSGFSIETSVAETFAVETTAMRNEISEQTETVFDNGKININTANEQLLITLPSIGPAIAKSIIEYRNQHGNFTSIEQIKKVKRIGDKTFEKIKNKITVG